ncbi:uncharacterized protein ColSpa_08912 [Colletotrichum spaethianum]|uniref:Uncharacterized protein n=1 Tax=Colletotrichum spaethianum TaxID=700344 RepID=A0AA37PAQ8_9PEZI|nr:uncharacterized protein ColSpa_08912 [Colletotrichum spaethianum]GKT48731.1 hypothetical protein ColSpa_08912 [Colletotrichum spaethianum]
MSGRPPEFGTTITIVGGAYPNITKNRYSRWFQSMGSTKLKLSNLRELKVKASDSIEMEGSNIGEGTVTGMAIKCDTVTTISVRDDTLTPPVKSKMAVMERNLSGASSSIGSSCVAEI